MERKKIIIAIDGYSSTGKSSLAKLIASKLNYIYVDTGALYRAVTLFAWTNGFIDDKNRVDKYWLKKNLSKIKINFKTNKEGISNVYLNGNNLGNSIRYMEISQKVSVIAAIPFVREYVDGVLRMYGAEKGVVMDGRDIGTAVFPNAEFKIFMTASVDVRAKRRHSELVAGGKEESFEEVLRNLKERDRLDETRTVNPLARAEDALLLDNTNLTIEQELNWVNEILEVRLGLSFVK
jgi:cytidylate kinase